MDKMICGKPKIFIGSSERAYELVKWLGEQIRSHDFAIPVEWKSGGFAPSKSTLQNLIEQCKACDFAVIFFTRDDDKVATRHYGSDPTLIFKGPRDNTIFEAGLFVGGLGLTPERCILVSSVKESTLPSDIRGVTYIPINEPPPTEPPLNRIPEEWCVRHLQPVLQSVILSVKKYGELLNRPVLKVMTRRQLAERQQVGKNCLEKYDRVVIASSEPEDCCDFILAQAVSRNLQKHIYYDFHFLFSIENLRNIASQWVDLIRILLACYLTVDEDYTEGDLKRDDDINRIIQVKLETDKDAVDDALCVFKRQLKFYIHKDDAPFPVRVTVHNFSSYDKAVCYLRNDGYYVEWKLHQEAKLPVNLLGKQGRSNDCIFQSSEKFHLYRTDKIESVSIPEVEEKIVNALPDLSNSSGLHLNIEKIVRDLTDLSGLHLDIEKIAWQTKYLSDLLSDNEKILSQLLTGVEKKTTELLFDIEKIILELLASKELNYNIELKILEALELCFDINKMVSKFAELDPYVEKIISELPSDIKQIASNLPSVIKKTVSDLPSVIKKIVPDVPSVIKNILMVIHGKDEEKTKAIDTIKAAIIDTINTAINDYIRTNINDYIKSAINNNIKTTINDKIKVAIIDNVKTAINNNLKVAINDNVKTAINDTVKVAINDEINKMKYYKNKEDEEEGRKVREIVMEKINLLFDDQEIKEKIRETCFGDDPLIKSQWKYVMKKLGFKADKTVMSLIEPFNINDKSKSWEVEDALKEIEDDDTLLPIYMFNDKKNITLNKRQLTKFLEIEKRDGKADGTIDYSKLSDVIWRLPEKIQLEFIIPESMEIQTAKEILQSTPNDNAYLLVTKNGEKFDQGIGCISKSKLFRTVN